MDFEERMSYSQLAFYTGDFEKAIFHAKKLEPKNAEVYELIAKSYQAMGNSEMAIESFKKAVNCDINNGNRYVELGIAYGSAEMPFEALESFAKAEELKCADDHMGAMYRTLAMVDYEIGRYDDAVINFTKAQKFLEPDIELLMYKSLACSMSGDIESAIKTVNQIKQIAPSSYNGYNLAYTFLMHSERFEDAKKELSEAYQYVKPLPMDFYFDFADWEQAQYSNDNDKEHLMKILAVIEDGMRYAKPDVNEVVNAYIQAADAYIQFGDSNRYDNAIELLKASENPVFSYNSGLYIFWPEEKEHEPLISEETFNNFHAYDNFDMKTLEDMVLSVEKEGESVQKSSTNTEKSEVYKLDKNEPINYTDEIRERICMLYIGAYTGKKDYVKALEYIYKIKDSKNSSVSHVGHYLEVKTKLDMQDGILNENIINMYNELIDYYRKEAIKDPSNITVTSYRVQCYIDIGEYRKARSYCSNLPESVKEPLLKQINDTESNSNNKTKG